MAPLSDGAPVKNLR